MNKQELIYKTSKKLNMDQDEARQVINTSLNFILEALEEGERVNLRGFGAFEKVETERNQRNPNTGNYKVITIKRVKFKPAENVKAIL